MEGRPGGACQAGVCAGRSAVLPLSHTGALVLLLPTRRAVDSAVRQAAQLKRARPAQHTPERMEMRMCLLSAHCCSMRMNCMRSSAEGEWEALLGNAQSAMRTASRGRCMRASGLPGNLLLAGSPACTSATQPSIKSSRICGRGVRWGKEVARVGGNERCGSESPPLQELPPPPLPQPHLSTCGACLCPPAGCTAGAGAGAATDGHSCTNTVATQKLKCSCRSWGPPLAGQSGRAGLERRRSSRRAS